MRNIKLVVAYDGTAYHGFQRQANAITIQAILEDKMAKLFGHKITMAGAGRTDAGVHAYGQVVSFKTNGTIPVEKIPLAARGILPGDIVVRSAEEVDARFHARKSALSKVYTYRIHQTAINDPFVRHYVWNITKQLNVESMHRAAQLVVGTHDFSAFKAMGGGTSSPVRTLMMACCQTKGDIVEFTFWGTGFLYHMVRNLVGTMINVGVGKLTIEGFAAILANRNRMAAGMTAPARGLFLQEVFY